MKKLISALISWQVRFSKVITIVCLGMNVIVCLWAMVCHVVGLPVDPSTLAVLLAPWQIELGFNMGIKMFDLIHNKNKKTEVQDNVCNI